MNTRWIYNVIEIRPGVLGGFKPERIQEELNRQGLLGWELVNLTFPAPMRPALAVFKREQ